MGTGAVRRYLAEQGAVLDQAAARLRAGDRTAVHPTRVAVRRARSTLRTFAACFEPGPARQLDAALIAHADRVARVRDLEVLVEVFEEQRADQSAELSPWISDRLTLELDATWREAREALAAEDDGELGARFRAVLAASAGGSLPLGRIAARAGERAARRLAAAGGDPDALHEARKAAKRARYAAEVSGDDAIAARHQHVQQILGTHHDLIVAARWLATAPVEPEMRADARHLGVRLEAAAADCLGDLI
ncbi:CHAD domain-containing protein [Nocardioides jejuensis]|uniref:CHAD domain-containing protein n=1 Tax=Nocardioides jejuensis TaxID=2502782 RepID=A0A4R1BVU3_9ACTN|nr:CHAD domain-containing protein [Nocardioides jejuensis]TCJ21597.1 CHAD domain-containing protein [Nocardioides jejuensis]